MKNASRKRFRYLPAIVVVIAAGLASRRFPGLLPAFLGKYPGDALWALMVFLAWGLVLVRTSSIWIALYALGISYLVEFSQLYQAPWINSIRATTIGHLVLGSGFSWPDLVAYAVGVLIGVLGERITGIRTPGRQRSLRRTLHRWVDHNANETMTALNNIGDDR